MHSFSYCLEVTRWGETLMIIKTEMLFCLSFFFINSMFYPVRGMYTAGNVLL